MELDGVGCGGVRFRYDFCPCLFLQRECHDIPSQLVVLKQDFREDRHHTFLLRNTHMTEIALSIPLSLLRSAPKTILEQCNATIYPS